MMRRRMRRLHTPEDRYDAMIEVDLWGYPRRLGATDRDPNTMWFRFGDDCIWWAQLLEDRSLCFHLCIHSDARRRGGLDARRLMYGWEWLADMADAARMCASDCIEDGEVASYLERLGWQIDEEMSTGPIVWYTRILDGSETEASEDHPSRY